MNTNGHNKIAALMILAILFLNTAFAAENWPHWRGPDNNGISTETGLPATWSKTENIKWRLKLPGSAPSTPVIWNGRIFLTSAEGDEMALLCVDTSGKILWKKPLGDRRTRFHQPHSHTGAPSPSTDGRHVWAFTGKGILACFDLGGTEIWRTDLQERYNRFSMYHGMSTTPLLDGDRLYIQLIHDHAQLVLALDKVTGKEIWKHNRKTDARMENLHSYSSPVIYRQGGDEQLIVHGADYVTAHSLKNGDEIWRCGGLQDEDRYNDYLRFVASPVVAPGLVVVPSAKNGTVNVIKPGRDYALLATNSLDETLLASPAISNGTIYLRTYEALYAIGKK